MGYWEEDEDGVERFIDDSNDASEPSKPNLKNYWGPEASAANTVQGPFVKKELERPTPHYTTMLDSERDAVDEKVEGYATIYNDNTLPMATRNRAYRRCQELIESVIGREEVSGSGQVPWLTNRTHQGEAGSKEYSPAGAGMGERQKQIRGKVYAKGDPRLAQRVRSLESDPIIAARIRELEIQKSTEGE